MDREKRKLLFIGDGVRPTGFSTVIHNIIKNLPKEWEIHHLAVNYGGDPHEYTHKIYPAQLGGDIWGLGRIESFGQNKFDAIFILNDIWVIAQYLELIKRTWTVIPPIVVYFPVDAESFDADWFKDFDIVSIPLVYTEFGKRVCEEVAPKDIKFRIIPHGVDNKVFHDLNKEETRKKLFPEFKELHDAFIFLNVGRNQPRKMLPIAMEGFKLFAEDKENVYYYHHAGLIDAGWNVAKLAKRFDIDSKFVNTNNEIGIQTVPVEFLNLIYNATDVGLNTCYVPKTKVLTSNGYKNIENVAINDIVFSHSGKERKVTNCFSYDKENEELLKITPFGILPLTLTKNHKLFSVLSPYLKLNSKYKQELLNNLNPDFYESSLLMEGSLVTVPIIKDEKVSIGTNKAFIYGAFVADGSVNKSGVVFSLNTRKNDDDLRNEIIRCMKEEYDLEPHFYNMDRNRQNLTFHSAKLRAEFKEMFGTGAHTKHIPNELLFMKLNEKLSFLKAAILGGGHFDRYLIEYVTVSEELAWQVWFLLTTIGYLAPSISQRTRGEFCVRVYGEPAKQFSRDAGFEDKSKKFLNHSTRKQRSKFFVSGDHIYYPIRKIEPIEYTGKVYDLEVEVEHSYLTHVAGHNSLGEGWGLPNVEHAITGAPQIVPDSSACRELFSDCGLLIPTTMDHVYPSTLTVGKLVSPEDVAEQMEVLYSNKDLYTILANAGKQKFADKKYTWEEISNQFIKAFDDAWQL